MLRMCTAGTWALASLASIASLAAIASLSTIAPIARADAELDPALLAPPKPVTDTYGDTKVVDDYRYLENVHAPDVTAWTQKQAARTAQWLERYPHYDDVAARITELRYNPSITYWGLEEQAGHLFAYKNQPPKQLPFLVIIDDVMTGRDRTVFDPMAFDSTGASSIDFFVPSPDGQRVAISISKQGTEDGTLHILDVASGAFLDDVIPRVNGGTAGGDIAWTPAGDGFFYTRYPHPGERPDEDLFFYQTIWFHTLGDPLETDAYVLGESFPRIAEIDFESTEDGSHVIARVSDGDGGYYEFWLHTAGGGWTKFAAFDDLVSYASFGGADTIHLLSRKNAPKRRILRVRVDDPSLGKAEIAVPEGEHAIEAFVSGGDGSLYVSEIRGGPTVVRAYDPAGARVTTLGADEIATYGSLATYGGGILFRRESYTDPRAWYALAAGATAPTATGLVTSSPVDYSDCVVTREFATADDGTRIPISILRLQSTVIDGATPTLLYAYGSYGLSQRPGYSTTRRAWLEQGCVYAVANIRGGGEFGEQWHRQANLENKKVSIDDLAACAKYLVDAGYTVPERLAIEGGSAGGLLVYGVAVHYPGPRAHGRFPRGDLRHVARRVLPQRGVQHHRVRHGEEPQATPRAPRPLSVSPREGRRGLSRDVVPHRDQRSAGRAVAVLQDDGEEPPGRGRIEPRPPSRRHEGGPRSGHDPLRGSAKKHRRSRLLFERLGVDYRLPEPRAD